MRKYLHPLGHNQPTVPFPPILFVSPNPSQITQDLRNFLASSSKLRALRSFDPNLFSSPEVGFKLLNSFLYEVANVTARICDPVNQGASNMTAKQYFQVFFDSLWPLLPEFMKLQDDGVKIYDGKNTHSLRSYVRCVVQRRFNLACKKYSKPFLPVPANPTQENAISYY